MKKFFALLLAAAMLFCMAAIPAAADGVVTFTVGTVNDVTPGATVTIPVSISAPNGYEAHTLTMHVRYNTEFLTVTNITGGEAWYPGLPDDATKIKDFTTNPGDISIGFLCPTEAMTATGVFVNVTFVVSENCTEDQVLTIDDIELYNYPLNGSPIAIETAGVNGAINLVHAADPTEVPPTEVPPTEVPPTEPTPVEPGQMSAAFAITPRTVAADGDTITIALSVSGSYEAHTLNAAVDYNPAALELVGVEKGAALNNAPDDAAIIIDDESYEGSIRIGLVAPSDGFTATGVLLVMTFKVKAGFAENFADGTLITVAVPEFDNMPLGAAVGTPIPVTVSSGVVVPKGGDEPGPGPGPGPNPPVTGAVSLIGLGVLAIASGAGVVIFRKKED